MNSISWKLNESQQLLKTLKEQTNKLADVSLDSIKKTEDKISILVPILSPLIQTIQNEKNSPLPKLFVRWLGKKEEIRKEKLDPELIARHLLDLTESERKRQVGLLFDKMDEITQLFAQVKFSKTLQQPKHFNGVSTEQFDKNFSKSYHSIVSTLALISQLENSKIENIQEITKALKIWCSHFLVTAAKAPYIENSKDCAHYPHGEYDDNEPHYHREDGGAVVKKFLAELRKLHPWLKPDFHVNLIKNEEFSSLILINCDLLKYSDQSIECIEIDSLPLNETLNQSSLSEYPNLFLDFSRLVQNKLYDTKNSSKQNLLDEITQFIDDFSGKNPTTKIIYGGVVKNRGTQDFYFFHSKDSLLLSQFREKFVSIQACHGSYPEIMFLKSNLVELGKIEDLLTAYPLQVRQNFEKYLQITPIYSPHYTEEDVHRERQALITCITKLNQEKHSSKLLKFYFSFFFSLLNSLPTSLTVKDPQIFKIVIERMQKIKKLLSQSKNYSFQESLSVFSLVVEHIQFLLIFFKIDQTEILSQLLNTQKPLNEKIDKHSFTFTSGIACYGNIVQGLVTIFSNSQLNVLFTKDSYYELIDSSGSLRECMNRNGKFKCTVDSFKDPNKIKDLLDQDIVFADLYPNRVIYESVLKIEIKEIVDPILKNRTASQKNSKPLIVVLDCATTLFMHDEIQEILDYYSKAIEEGKLIIILTNSFAKYVMGGFDKFPGGAAIVFGSKQTQNTKELGKKLAIRSKADSFSPEAHRTFYLLIKNCSGSILFYLEKIRENTNFLYEDLERKGLVLKKDANEKMIWQEPIQIGIRSPNIPMIGLHFNYMYYQIFEKQEINEDELNVIVILMQYYLFTKFVKKENLPVTLKQSFGFPPSNLIECWTALRLTPGLEENEKLEKYATIIKEINDELKLILSNSEQKQELTNKIKKLVKTENLKNKIYKKQALVLKEELKGFKNFIDFFIQKDKQEKNLHSLESILPLPN